MPASLPTLAIEKWKSSAEGVLTRTRSAARAPGMSTTTANARNTDAARLSFFPSIIPSIEKFFGVKRLRIGQLLDLAKLHQRIEHDRDRFFIEMPVGEEHRHFGVIGLARNVVRKLGSGARIDEALFLMRVHPLNRLEPCFEEAAQRIGTLLHQIVGGVSRVGQERLDEVAEIDKELTRVLRLQQQRAFERRRDRVDVAGHERRAHRVEIAERNDRERVAFPD